MSRCRKNRSYNFSFMWFSKLGYFFGIMETVPKTYIPVRIRIETKIHTRLPVARGPTEQQITSILSSCANKRSLLFRDYDLNRNPETIAIVYSRIERMNDEHRYIRQQRLLYLSYFSKSRNFLTLSSLREIIIFTHFFRRSIPKDIYFATVAKLLQKFPIL